MRSQSVNISDPTDSIQTREDFIAFVQRLSKDFRNNPTAWDNDKLGTYLESLAAWTHDMDGYYHNKGEEPPTNVNWRFIAQLLLAARVYE